MTLSFLKMDLKIGYMLNRILFGLALDALTIKLSNFLLMLDKPAPEVGDINPIPKPFPERAEGVPSASCNPPKVLPSKNDPTPHPVICLLETAFPLIVFE